jgi:hypothetical protein
MVPTSHTKMKKVILEVGLEMKHIHACVKDCVLFQGDDNCPSYLIVLLISEFD